jgi:hypothetical protein
MSPLAALTVTAPISIVRSLPLECGALVATLRGQLELLEEASEHGTVVLAATIMGNGRVAVPVRLRVSYPPTRAQRFGLSIAALKTPSIYPRFHGELTLADVGAAVTTLTLSGEYQVPFGVVGRAFDATAARGIAPRGLADLVDRLVANVLAEIGQESDATYRALRYGE